MLGKITNLLICKITKDLFDHKSFPALERKWRIHICTIIYSTNTKNTQSIVVHQMSNKMTKIIILIRTLLRTIICRVESLLGSCILYSIQPSVEYWIKIIQIPLLYLKNTFESSTIILEVIYFIFY